MKHCFTECIKVSDDEYRTRFDCKICKKSFYQLKDRIATRNGTAGSILLKNGSPYVTCGNCQSEVKLHEGYTIRILLGWEQTGQEYVYLEGFHPIVNADANKRIVVPRFKPVIKTAHGCLACFDIQARGGSKHYFGGK